VSITALSQEAPKRAALLEVEGLQKTYPITRGLIRRREAGWVRALAGVSFTVARGETFGIVGESGCGKSTLARCILRLVEPSAGAVRFHPVEAESIDITRADPVRLRSVRRQLQIVFQDPYASLNPRMTAVDIVSEPLDVHKVGAREERRERARHLIEVVGLGPEHVRRRPAELSGGQRQRLGIARALALNPELLILDEPVSALDVSIQAQVLNLLADLREGLGLAYVFIAHDLSIVRQFSDRVAVMYLGKIVELAATDRLFSNPLHPYTRTLLSAIPVPTAARRRHRIAITGEPPSPLDPPPGCAFHPRCPAAVNPGICVTISPDLIEVELGHLVACHFPGVLG